MKQKPNKQTKKKNLVEILLSILFMQSYNKTLLPDV